MSLTISHGCWFSLTVSQVPLCFCMSITVSYLIAGCLLHSVWSHGVSAFLSLSPMIAGFLSLSLPVPCSSCMFFTLSYRCWIPFTVSLISWSCYISVIVASCLSLSAWSCNMCLTVSHSCWLSLQSHGVATCLSLLLSVSHCPFHYHGFVACLSLTLPVPWSCCKSFTVSYGCWLSLTVSTGAMKLLHVSNSLPLLLAVSSCLCQFHVVAACL